MLLKTVGDWELIPLQPYVSDGLKADNNRQRDDSYRNEDSGERSVFLDRFDVELDGSESQRVILREFFHDRNYINLC